ncbi:hypothetical protein QMK19_35355 [Streptomyces sp. H10-C2]|uniref:hypothetical protein n=1 Tax=unclassified Streptomyces TaxID=2593676 RepID=UPI0024B8E533|nr:MULTISPECIES: hypothetical protein [unclassified Streptomyces]MDJ0345913.1 hypothetical protein [Streptomyces sp. PH10-H1]MDJ0374762.1 hypothetical protein [Streptomyces sp. H10-C2]
MTKRSTLQQRARELQAAEGMGYTQALASVREQAGTLVYVLQPTAAEAADGITAEELGVRALPAHATPAQKARAESLWRSSPAHAPCRCSGGCDHGKPCDILPTDDPQHCAGLQVHVDRLAARDVITTWFDVHECAVCGDIEESEIEQPDLPWGDTQADADDDQDPDAYAGVRQAGSPLLCRTCGWTGGMACPECDGCGCSHDCTGWRHAEYANDDEHDSYGCRECGAGSGNDPYGECCCYDDEEDEVA